MKKLSIIALLAMAASASAATVQVRIDGVTSDKGVVQVAVCDEANFRKDCQLTATVPARKGVVMADVPDVPAGTWAVLAYHDENGNKKLDTNFVGMPKEGYGFSNGAKGTFGPPSFKEAAIPVGEGKVTAVVTLTY
jgi:uncharacterized protein (DUF2141 family)